MPDLRLGTRTSTKDGGHTRHNRLKTLVAGLGMLAILTASAGFSPRPTAAAPTGSVAAPAATYYSFVSHTRWAPFFYVRVNASVRFEDGRAYEDWVDCQPFSVVLAIDIKWCGSYNSGDPRGLGYMDVGVNYQVNYLANGFPLSYPEAFRIRVYNDGRVAILRYYY